MAGRASGSPPASADAGPRDLRPRFHVSPPSGWLNDPNGPVHRDGRYHLFYQRNPAGPVWAPAIHWGHVASTDLLRWSHRPDAFGPTPGGPDEGGCWSGCIVDDGGVPTAVYSGLGAMSELGATTVCLARALDDELVAWRKDEANPVIPGPPPGVDLVAFRDPFVWREDEAWSMLLGAGLREGGGAALLYRSADLVAWSYEGVLFSRPADSFTPLWTGEGWECPQLFPLGDAHVLLVSVWEAAPPHIHYAAAFVGRYDGRRFEADHVERFDHGADCYAPATLADDAGRRLAWGWSWEAREEAAARDQGWAGTLTLPRVLSLTPGGRLAAAPAPELLALRGSCERLAPRRVVPGSPLVAETRGDRLEIDLAVEVGDADAVRLLVCAAAGGEEQTAVEWERESGRLTIDRSRSSLDARARGGRHGVAVDLGAGGGLRLRAFVDGSILEVFANDRLAFTERIYPTRPDSDGVALVTEGAELAVQRLDVWTLRLPA